MKFGFFGIPHTGGTYTVYKHLRDGLSKKGIDVRWIGVGPEAASVRGDSTWEHEWQNGDVVAGDTVDEAIQGRQLVEHLEDAGYHGVFVNVLANRAQTNAVRYLYSDILRIMIVHSISLGTYAAARSIRDYVHNTIAVSPRIKDDLVKKYAFRANRIDVISHSIDFKDYDNIERYTNSVPLKLISLGRVEDLSKGVLWLPEIIKLLDSSNVTLTIVGDGPDLNRLKSACAELKEQVRFTGSVPLEEVPFLFSQHDVFIMPSRFEGFGHTLLEAMAAGCVPISSRIRGTTEYIVQDGENGFLFPIGDCRSAAHLIAMLANDKQLLERMSINCKRTVNDRFNIERMVSDYSKAIYSIRTKRPFIKQPLDINDWYIPYGLKPGLRTILPDWFKNMARKYREVFRL
ncbi:MAG: glycosyltransferase family 4 protein [Thermodesulfobacteriota bacterium]